MCNYLRTIFLGGNCLDGNCLEGNCPGYSYPRWELSGGIIWEAIVVGGNCPRGNCSGGIVLFPKMKDYYIPKVFKLNTYIMLICVFVRGFSEEDSKKKYMFILRDFVKTISVEKLSSFTKQGFHFRLEVHVLRIMY